MSTLLEGDCLHILPLYPSEYFHSIVTDPPYGLSFMGAGWDHGVPGVPYWHEALRVLRPGGYLLAFGGTRTSHRLTVAIEDAGFEIRDVIMWLYGSGFPKSHDVGKAIDRAAGAEQWNGWGTALKPSYEPIIVARRPLSEPTVAANVLRWGTGGLNIDGCRVGTDTGRWPANTILEDGEVAAMLDEQSGELTSGEYASHHKNSAAQNIGTFKIRERAGEDVRSASTGGASRFFYQAKAGRKERYFLCRTCATVGNERKAHEGHELTFHPTQKPLELIQYLQRLVTPPGGTTLDPFMGSGTAGVAAGLEGFDFTGIDKEPDFITLARGRVQCSATAAKKR